LLEKLTKEQLDEWIVFESISPIGERRADTRAAVQTAYLRAAWVEGEDQSPETFKPNYAIYNTGDEHVAETLEEQVIRDQIEANQFR
jgi:hypothetical protein